MGSALLFALRLERSRYRRVIRMSAWLTSSAIASSSAPPTRQRDIGGPQQPNERLARALPPRGAQAGPAHSTERPRAVPPRLRGRHRHEPSGGEGVGQHAADSAAAQAEVPAGRAESHEDRLGGRRFVKQREPRAQERHDVGAQVDPAIAALPAHDQLGCLEVEIRKVDAVDLDRPQPPQHGTVRFNCTVVLIGISRPSSRALLPVCLGTSYPAKKRRFQLKRRSAKAKRKR